MNTGAYDYDTQQWMSGDHAAALRIRQITEELTLLQGPSGEQYARFINCDRNKAIEQLTAELTRLQ